MSEDAPIVEEPKDDAVVVKDDPIAAEEKAHDELVSNVAEMLDKEKKDETPPGKPEEDVKKEEPAPEGFDKDLQSRAEKAGIQKELAERLHQSGQLEETLTAFDRRMIDYIQSKETPSKDEEPPKGEERREQEPPKDQDVLDKELWDEDAYKDLTKRDAYYQQRIESLESKLTELVEDRQGGFDGWFDGVLGEMGIDVNDNDKCQSTFKAYHAMCEAHGINPNSRDHKMAERAYTAMFPQDVYKKAQKQTVDRLRDSEGKFLSSPQSKGGPPPKGASEEEVHDHLVSNVTALLKERGVQMSGI